MEREVFKGTDNQFTLGELINAIEKCGVKRDRDGEPKTIVFDFGSAQPTIIASWRGAYNEMALGYELSGYDVQDSNQVDAERFLNYLKLTIGETFEGWKGGDYIASEDCPLWVANPGNNSNSVIIGIYDAGYELVLLTGYTEY